MTLNDEKLTTVPNFRIQPSLVKRIDELSDASSFNRAQLLRLAIQRGLPGLEADVKAGRIPKGEVGP